MPTIQLNIHTDGTKSCLYEPSDAVLGDIAIIAYPTISIEILEQIKTSTPERFQEILSSLVNL